MNADRQLAPRSVREATDAGVGSVLRTPGTPLDARLRASFASQLDPAGRTRDFAGVRVHADGAAARSAHSLDAAAYTVGNNVVFGHDRFAPGRDDGRRLLAHELAHVVQQAGAVIPTRPRVDDTAALEAEAQRAALTSAAGRRASVVGAARAGIQRQTLGTRVRHPVGATSSFKKVEATFDGQDFILRADGRAILTVAGQSGRPISVRAADATACGGSTSDSYLNNPRYVGIHDNGPIPEGEYQFTYEQMATFSGLEQARMITGGHYTDPFGTPLHGGDWGSGRVALRPIRILPGRRGCGNTATRSGFFLHGGSLPGSSGCIDVGNQAIDDIVRLLAGFRGRIVVRVHYTHSPPTVGAGTRALGRITYPGGDDPSMLDRFKALFGGDE